MKADPNAIYNSVNLTAAQAEEVMQDAYPVIEGAEELPPESEKNLSAVYDRLKILFDMVKDIYRGEYTALDKTAAAAAVLAIVYVVSPLDLIPEVIPGVGIVDDIAILSFAAGLCANEIKKYMEFKKGRQTGTVISRNPYQ